MSERQSLTMYLVRDNETGLFFRRKQNKHLVRIKPQAKYGPLVTAKVFGQAFHAAGCIKFHGLDASVVECKLSVLGCVKPHRGGFSEPDSPEIAPVTEEVVPDRVPLQNLNSGNKSLSFLEELRNHGIDVNDQTWEEDDEDSL